MQGLVHNSGCGPSDIGPSVFIGLDRNAQAYGPDMVNLKFATVPQKQQLEYNFVNITAPVCNQSICTTEHEFIDADYNDDDDDNNNNVLLFFH